MNTVKAGQEARRQQGSSAYENVFWTDTFQHKSPLMNSSKLKIYGQYEC